MRHHRGVKVHDEVEADPFSASNNKKWQAARHASLSTIHAGILLTFGLIVTNNKMRMGAIFI